MIPEDKPPSAEDRDVAMLDRDSRRMVALVVDDSASQRAMLKLLMKRYGFDVYQARDGREALDICQNIEIDIVISDWMMPSMTGPELCRALRREQRDRYIYVILLTSKRDKLDVATGLDAGADDFLSKPMDKGELLARLRAGQRILDMQEALSDKTRRITEAFDRLNTLYAGIERDLKAAGRLQRSLIPQAQSVCEGADIGVYYRPAGHVGGDLVGFFRLGPGRIGVYSIDVSGHGVSSALLTARLHNLFDDRNVDENIAVARRPDGAFVPREPAAVATELNARLQDEADTDQYFTMVYADCDLTGGLVRFCQAGHPSPLILRRNGQVELVGSGGPPIGMLSEFNYETGMVQLQPGEKLLLYSDGLIEAEGVDGTMIEEEGLAGIWQRHQDVSERAALEGIVADIVATMGTQDFTDDLSAILITQP